MPLHKFESMCIHVDSGNERRLARPERGKDVLWKELQLYWVDLNFGERNENTRILPTWKYSLKPPFHRCCNTVRPVLRVCLQGMCWVKGEPTTSAMLVCSFSSWEGLLEVLSVSFFLEVKNYNFLKLLILYILALKVNAANTLQLNFITKVELLRIIPDNTCPQWIDFHCSVYCIIRM